MVRLHKLALAVAATLSASGVAGAAQTLLVSNGQLNQPATDFVLAYDATTGAFKGDFVVPGNGLNGPRGLAYGADGNLYVANNGGNNVLKYDGKNGAFLGTFIATGVGGLNGPEQLAFHNGDLYVSSFNTGKVLKYNAATGAPDGVAASGEAGADGFNFDKNGNLFVAASQPAGFMGGTGRGDEVDQFDATGTFVKAFATGFGSRGPRDLVFDNSGNALVTTPEAPDAKAKVALDAVEKFSSAGTDLGAFVTAGSGGLSLPRHLEFGPNGSLFVSSQNSNAILEYKSADGSFMSAFASSGGLNRPTYFTFHDVSSLQHPVPLPAAAWSGLALLTTLGAASVVRRRGYMA